MSGCSGNCSSCGESCSDRKQESLLAEPNKNSQVKKVIAVVSGKGGVGKSTVTSMLAMAMHKLGYKTAILDADITGPSIPKAFGLHEQIVGSDDGMLPAVTPEGIKVMSINLLLPNETDPVIWRGPVIGGAVKQFWTDVCWGEVDYMFVDLPPGTGDVMLTVFQSLPIDGVVIVTSPQSLVSMIVSKAVNMARMMNIPVYGFVENYSYFQCPDCGKRVEIFGKSKLDELALQFSLPVLARLPIDPAVAASFDAGRMAQVNTDPVMPAAELMAKELPAARLLQGELAPMRLRLSQICIKTQTANSVCSLERKKRAQRKRGSANSGIRSVEAGSDAPPAAPSFPSCRKRRGGEKGRWVTVGCFLRLNSGKHQCFGLAFHSVVTLRISYYAPPDTREPGLWAVAFEYLQSIEGAGRICWSAPFCGEGLCHAL